MSDDLDKACALADDLINSVTAPIIRRAEAAEAEVARLREALEELWQLIEDGVLVRDISGDTVGSTFTMQGLKLVATLQKVRQALTKDKSNG